MQLPVDPAARLHTLRLPADGTCAALVPGANPDYAATALTFTTSSPITPGMHYAVNLAMLTALARSQPGGETALAHLEANVTPVALLNSKLDTNGLSCYVTYAQGHDGIQVPMTVAHLAGLPYDGHAPALLVAYGAYGLCLEADFRPERLTLLRRGWVLVLAHVRGGGEMGRTWHTAGAGMNKPTSVDDLETCLEHLFTHGLSRPGHVAVHGTSAGGVVVGALLNRRSNDLGAAVLHVPFVDVLNTMRDPGLPLTVHEYDEWGDPRQPAALCALQVKLTLWPFIPQGLLNSLTCGMSAETSTIGIIGFKMLECCVRPPQSSVGCQVSCHDHDMHPICYMQDAIWYSYKTQQGSIVWIADGSFIPVCCSGLLSLPKPTAWHVPTNSGNMWRGRPTRATMGCSQVGSEAASLPARRRLCGAHSRTRTGALCRTTISST